MVGCPHQKTGKALNSPSSLSLYLFPISSSHLSLFILSLSSLSPPPLFLHSDHRKCPHHKGESAPSQSFLY
ncbi:hypothetical protein I7I48_11837 [Histoplasma ohiense]|nr:hypothetical protein I7I48_11837 [Histoplasma ohiense (nom. inval.)]